MNILISHLLVVVVGLFFWGDCLHGFMSQDAWIFLLYGKTQVDIWNGLGAAFFNVGPVDNDYLPITHAYYILMVKVFGSDPFHYHLASLVFHIVNAVLLLWIIKILFQSIYLGVLGAVFYLTRSFLYVAVHWVPATQDLLGMFFCLWLILFLIFYFRTAAHKYLALALCMYALAIYSREISLLVIFSIIPLYLYFFSWEGKNTLRRLIGLLLPFALIGGLCLGFGYYVTRGYETVISFDALHIDRFMIFLTWMFNGRFHVHPVQKMVVFLAILVMVTLPLCLAFSGRQTRRRLTDATLPLLFFIGAMVVSLPQLLVKDRLVQYYGYFPLFFVILSLAAGIRFILEDRLEKRLVIPAYVLLVVLVIVSTVGEYRVVQSKGRPSYLKTEKVENGKHYIIFSNNPAWEWSGGWLNWDFRIKTGNFYEDLRKMRPEGFPRDSRLLLFGWEEIFVSGNPLRTSKQLHSISVTESMLRVLMNDAGIELRFVNPPHARIVPKAQEYYLDTSGIDEFLNQHGQNVFIFFVDPVEGYIMNYLEVDRIERALVHSVISEYIRWQESNT